MFRTHRLACIAVVLFSSAACDKKSESSPSGAPSGAPSAASAAPAPAASSSPPTSTATAEGSGSGANAPIVGSDAPPFKVVATPSVADVPATAVVGSANGHTFQPKAIFFEPEKKGWKLVMSDKAIDKPTDFTKPGAQTINLSLNTSKLAAGQKISKPMKNGDGFFQIVKPDDATKTTSWNTKNAYYVEITKWDVKPYDEKGGSSQQAGTASGKVYVVHEANDMSKKSGFANSGVAGTFTDVPVRYRGQPKFED